MGTLCAHESNDVIDSRKAGDNVHRRRRCRLCGHRWDTLELPRSEYDALRTQASRDSRIGADMLRVLAEHGYVDLTDDADADV